MRKSLSFSKCDRMHELALRLFVQHYNLSLTHNHYPKLVLSVMLFAGHGIVEWSVVCA